MQIQDTPLIQKAMQIWAYQGVFEMPGPDHVLPEGHDWQRVEAFLGTLNEDQLSDFAINEHRPHGPDAEYAAGALDAILVQMGEASAD